MTRRTLLNVEGLDARMMPSATIGPVAVQGGPLAAPTLSGNARGHFQASPGNPDVGRTTTLSGAGDLAGMGHVTIAGSLTGIGNIASGHAGGTLTLTGAGGTVTLTLTGPTQAGPGALPSKFSYQVTGGTGSFSSLHSGGAIYLNLSGGDYFTLAIRPH
jgi:hypothetical protein